MASIQILELLPVEAQIDDLSYDTTNLIHGGSIPNAVDCIIDGLQEIGRELNMGLSAKELFFIYLEALTCAVGELLETV